MSDSDVSPFEIIHSGLVEKLLSYITYHDPMLRDLRLRKFLHVFLNCPVSWKNLYRRNLIYPVYEVAVQLWSNVIAMDYPFTHI